MANRSTTAGSDRMRNARLLSALLALATHGCSASRDRTDGGGGGGNMPLPQACIDALATKSYIGCDYWPTVTPNPVWSIFDYTVVVANTQSSPASIVVTGPGGTNKPLSSPAGGLSKIYLPWVTALKGPDCDSCGSVPAFAASVTAPASA